MFISLFIYQGSGVVCNISSSRWKSSAAVFPPEQGYWWSGLESLGTHSRKQTGILMDIGYTVDILIYMIYIYYHILSYIDIMILMDSLYICIYSWYILSTCYPFTVLSLCLASDVCSEAPSQYLSSSYRHNVSSISQAYINMYIQYIICIYIYVYMYMYILYTYIKYD